MELPPRTRRILQVDAGSIMRLGTTSAYAENTQRYRRRSRASRNYLRVRGEYLRLIHDEPIGRGTTSAYAENTLPHACIKSPMRNYLRVRGEYIHFLLRVQ